MDASTPKRRDAAPDRCGRAAAPHATHAGGSDVWHYIPYRVPAVVCVCHDDHARLVGDLQDGHQGRAPNRTDASSTSMLEFQIKYEIQLFLERISAVSFRI